METVDYTRHYTKWHSDDPSHVEAMKRYYIDMFEFIMPSSRETRILDIGCGMGFAMLALKEMGFRDVAGIELDRGQVESCLRKGLQVEQTDDTIAHLEHVAQTYDVIICLDVIEHIPHSEQLKFVKAIHLAMRGNGTFICTVPNANSVLATRWRYIDWTHHSSFTEHSLDFLLFNAGFDNIKINEIEFIRRPSYKFMISRYGLQAWYWKQLTQWFLFRSMRQWHRLQMIAELGAEQGKAVPLSLNLIATAVKSNEDKTPVI